MALARIICASMTGNTEEIAGTVAEAFGNLDIEVEINECTQVDADEFEEAGICIVATYTYDDDDLPDEIIDFYEDLQELDPLGKIYGVCRSGNTFYDEFYKSVDDFDAVSTRTGASRRAENVKVDLNTEEEDIENLEAFAKELVAEIQYTCNKKAIQIYSICMALLFIAFMEEFFRS